MKTELSITIEARSREEYRRKLAEHFLNEEPGKEGESSQYVYYVEEDKDGHRIYLKRPTNLNKGFDFEVRVEDVKFTHIASSSSVAGAKSPLQPRITKSNRPSHENIFDDLKLKKKENPSLFKQLRPLLEKVYNCQEVLPKEFEPFNFKSGYPIDLIFMCIKWLFIEQDITYWNWSGRAMFYKGLSEIWN